MSSSALREYRVVLRHIDGDRSSLAPGFTAVITAVDLADAKRKADDLARTLKGYRVVDVVPSSSDVSDLGNS